MIFVTLGSQMFQFNRLLKKIDDLIEDGFITDKVFAQIGYSDYIPKYYEYKQFLDQIEFSNIMDKCDIVITHGGTGAIIGAVKKDKKVIAVPRLRRYGEHVDDHQLQIVDQFNQNKLIKTCDVSMIKNVLLSINEYTFSKYKSNTESFINCIDEFIKEKCR